MFTVRNVSIASRSHHRMSELIVAEFDVSFQRIFLHGWFNTHIQFFTLFFTIL